METGLVPACCCNALECDAGGQFRLLIVVLFAFDLLLVAKEVSLAGPVTA
jgi:hypothetical protein